MRNLYHDLDESQIQERGGRNLVDELEQGESPVESPLDTENLPEREQIETGDEISVAEYLEAEKDEELATIKARIIELEQVVAERDEEISSLKRDGQEMENRLTSLNNSLSEAVSSYKAVVLQANPEVITELVSGDSISSVNESLEEAKNLVSRVRQDIETEISWARVPAGAPERTPPDLSALSPREKIQYAIGGKR